jgi:dihydroorotase
MRILIRAVQIADPASVYDGKQADILIENGIIQQVETAIDATADLEIQAGGYIASPGWLDAYATCGEPGEEWKEDLQSLAKAAAAGGFTSVAVRSGLHPVADNASAITSLVQKGENLPVNVLPLGTLTTAGDGKEMAELFDMMENGATGFTDGEHPIASTGLITRILEYSRDMKKPVYFFPMDKELAPGGKMHEGLVSTSLGLKGMPVISETAPLEAFLKIAQWLKAPARINGISSAASVDAIKAARAAGVDVRVTVPVFNLLFTDEALEQFDENHKVLPPYRTAKDKQALVQAVSDGIIDAVVSNHQPQDIENKAVEFDYAAWGASSVQTVLQALVAAGMTDLRFIYAALVSGPRKFMGLPVPGIAQGQPADITVFSTTTAWEFSQQNDFSKGVNNPLRGQTLKGQVLGTVCKGAWHPNSAVNVVSASGK